MEWAKNKAQRIGGGQMVTNGIKMTFSLFWVVLVFIYWKFFKKCMKKIRNFTYHMVQLKAAFLLDHVIFLHQCPEAAYQPHFHLPRFFSRDQIATPRDHFLNFNQKTFNFYLKLCSLRKSFFYSIEGLESLIKLSINAICWA